MPGGSHLACARQDWRDNGGTCYGQWHFAGVLP